MITPDEIRQKAERVFAKAVKHFIAGQLDSFFPHRLPANLVLPKQHAAAIDVVQRLHAGSKDTKGFGYRVVCETRRSRTHGRNDFPTAIVIETMGDLVRLINQDDAWRVFQTMVVDLRARHPGLEPWLMHASNWKRMLQVSDVYRDLFDILDFFVRHPRPDCFARELPIAVSTKLIENHPRLLAEWLDGVLPSEAIDFRFGYDAFAPRYGLRYARPHYLFRILDPQLQEKLELPFDELSLPSESLSQFDLTGKRILIIENKVSLLSFPRLTGAVALGGLGNGVTELSSIKWLLRNDVFYWGDLDADGFCILDRLREHVPGVTSVMMNPHSVERFSDLITQGNGARARDTPNLTESERESYLRLCAMNGRIEQEHLPIEAVLAALS